jgi:hypothetical protein
MVSTIDGILEALEPLLLASSDTHKQTLHEAIVEHQERRHGWAPACPMTRRILTLLDRCSRHPRE